MVDATGKCPDMVHVTSQCVPSCCPDQKISVVVPPSSNLIPSKSAVSECPSIPSMAIYDSVISSLETNSNAAAETLITCPPPINKESLISVSPFPIHSRYIVRDKVGQGTWGSVHLATERSSGLDRAVKKIPKRFTAELALFRQEITFLKSMDHPNIIRLYETFEDYANIYMVMEYCRGGELFDHVAASKYFCEASAAKLMRQILSTLCYIHSKNIAHRDLKPENFLFLSKSDNTPMKLIDFGLAKRFSSRRNLKTRVGTLYYVSPQVLSGSYNEKCDIWSAGVILYLLLAGVPPFNGPDDASIVARVREGDLRFAEPIWKKLSPLSRELVERLLCKDPDKRLSANEALQHPWFACFSPHRLAFYRTVSVPNDLVTFGLSIRDESFPGETQRAEATSDRAPPEGRCCKLSVFGAHSPLCSRTMRPELYDMGNFRSRQSPNSAQMCLAHNSDAQQTNAYASQKPVQHPVPPLPVALFPSVSLSKGSAVAAVGDPSLENAADNSPLAVNKLSSFEFSDAFLSPLSPTSLTKATEELRLWRHLVTQLVPKWTRFARRNQLERTAFRVLVHQMADDEILDPLRSLFNFFDLNNDGVLTSEDLIGAGRTLQALSCTLKRSASYGVDLDAAAGVSSPAATTLESMPRHSADGIVTCSDNDCVASSCTGRLMDTDRGSCLGNSSPLSASTMHSVSSLPTSLSTADRKRFSTDGSASLVGDQADGRSGHLHSTQYCSNDVHNYDWEQLGATLAVLVNKVALDGGDRLEYTDFLAATMDTQHYITESLLKATFGVFDRDGDSYINAAELRAALGWADIYSLPRQLACSAMYPSKSSKPVLQAIDEELKRIFSACDFDGDGSISYNDFVTAIKENSKMQSICKEGS